MNSLQELSLRGLQNPGQEARKYLPPWHAVRKALEERENSQMRAKYRQEHKIKLLYLMNELPVLEDLNWTSYLFPSHLCQLKLFVSLDPHC